jgi:hypothetical protein
MLKDKVGVGVYITTGICAIIKDCDENYLREWIDCHEAIGFDYFFIYDNESKNPIKELLKDYENIIVYDFPGKIQQLPAYMDCITKQKHGEQPKCDWLAFIDEDEFIVVESGNIKDFLRVWSNALNNKPLKILSNELLLI